MTAGMDDWVLTPSLMNKCALKGFSMKHCAKGPSNLTIQHKNGVFYGSIRMILQNNHDILRLGHWNGSTIGLLQYAMQMISCAYFSGRKQIDLFYFLAGL